MGTSGGLEATGGEEHLKPPKTGLDNAAWANLLGSIGTLSAAHELPCFGSRRCGCRLAKPLGGCGVPPGPSEKLTLLGSPVATPLPTCQSRGAAAAKDLASQLPAHT
uniref:Uncharacterized protein n=1 Tax=Sphaerodactylus townsendi TaxID=933632 RepID=A0ACB8FBX0_9SAUR